MNKMVDRSVRDTKDMLPVASPVQQEDHPQSLFLDPDISDLQPGSRLRGALLDNSRRGAAALMVEAEAPASTVSIALLVASHSVEKGRPGRSMPARIGP